MGLLLAGSAGLLIRTRKGVAGSIPAVGAFVVGLPTRLMMSTLFRWRRRPN